MYNRVRKKKLSWPQKQKELKDSDYLFLSDSVIFRRPIKGEKNSLVFIVNTEQIFFIKDFIEIKKLVDDMEKLSYRVFVFRYWREFNVAFSAAVKKKDTEYIDSLINALSKITTRVV